jgi:hypothetical protein
MVYPLSPDFAHPRREPQARAVIAASACTTIRGHQSCAVALFWLMPVQLKLITASVPQPILYPDVLHTWSNRVQIGIETIILAVKDSMFPSA